MTQVLGFIVLALVVLLWMYLEVCRYRYWLRCRRVRREMRRPPAPVVPFTEFHVVAQRKAAAAAKGIELDEIRLVAYVEPRTTNPRPIH